jgi:hypothetical protein
MTSGYLRYPHIHGDLLTFVAGDDRPQPALERFDMRKREVEELFGALPPRSGSPSSRSPGVS